MRKKIKQSIGWLTLERVIKSLVGLAMITLAYRYFNIDLIGEFLYAYSVILVISTITTFGIDGNIQKELSISLVKVKTINTIVLFRLGISFLAVFIILIYYALSETDAALIMLLLSLILIGKTSDIFKGIFELNHENKIISKLSLLSYFIGIVFRSISFYCGGIHLYAFSFSIESVIFLYFVFRNSDIQIKYAYFNTELLRDILIRSSPLILSSTIVMLNMRIDQVMIRNLMGTNDLAIYYASMRIPEAFNFLASIIFVVLMPIILKQAKENSLRGALYKWKIFSNFFSFIIAIGLLGIMPIAKMIFHSIELDEFVYVIYVLIVGLAMNGALNSMYSRVYNLERTLFFRQAGMVVLNIVCNFVLIPRFGTIGAGLSTLIAMLFSVCIYNLLDSSFKDLTWYYAYKNSQINIKNSFLQIFQR